MGKEKIKEVMQALSEGSANRTAIGRIRDIFDDIEIALSAGVKREAIWKALDKEGIKMPLKTFESAIFRIRKERGEKQKHQPGKPSVSSDQAVTKTPAAPGDNPLRALSGKPKEGEFNPIPPAKIEIDNS